MCSGPVFRALRHVARDHYRAQGLLGRMVRRVDPRILQEPLQVAPVVVPAQSIAPPWLVPILPATVAQLIGELLL
jgi:hypothetical protein